MYFEIYKDAKGEYRWRLKAANMKSSLRAKATPASKTASTLSIC